MNSKLGNSTHVTMELIDMMIKQHDSFKYNTEKFMNTLYSSTKDDQVIKNMKSGLNEIYTSICKMTLLLNDANCLIKSNNPFTEDYTQKNEDIRNTDTYNNELEKPKITSKHLMSVEKTIKSKHKKITKEKKQNSEEEIFIDSECTSVKKEPFSAGYQSLLFNNSSGHFICNNTSETKVKYKGSRRLDTDNTILINGFNTDDFITLGPAENPVTVIKNKDLVKKHQNSKVELILKDDNNKRNSQKYIPDIADINISFSSFNSKTKKNKKRCTYNICSLELKNEAIQLAKSTSIKEAAERLNIPDKNIKRWLQNGPERKKGAGRKTVDPKMEKEILKWISSQYRETNNFPLACEIKAKAKELSSHPKFKASKGWCDKFMKRNEMYFRYLTIDKAKNSGNEKL